MKKILLLSFLLSGFFANTQDNAVMGAPTNNLGLMGAEEGTMNFNALDISKISGVFYEFDDIRFSKIPTDGSVYLFDSWDNSGVIIVGENRFVTTNINLHINQDKFMTQLDNDSTFVFDFKGIDKVLIGGRTFKSFYNSKEGKNKIMEVTFENEQLKLLKGFSVSFVEGSENPMLSRSRNKIKLSTKYYLYKNGTLSHFKLKKKDILNLYSGNHVSEIEAYIKRNRLSYKKEKDLVKILQYASSL